MLTPPRRSPVEPALLVVSSEPEFSFRLAEELGPVGVVVTRALSGSEALERAHAHLDAILIDWTLVDMNGLQLCEELRREGRRSYTPILLATAVVPGRGERLAAMRAGAWDILIHPIDPEELQLKLARYMDSKRTTDSALAEHPIDPLTGLFSESGLLWQAQGVVSLAARQDTAVTCAVLETQANGTGPEGVAELAKRLAGILRSTARASDVIGRTGPTTFVVVAPATAPGGAVQMIERLTNAILRQTEEAGSSPQSIQLRVGYEAVESARQQSVTPDELLKHAQAAARSAWFGSTDRWVRRYSSTRAESV